MCKSDLPVKSEQRFVERNNRRSLSDRIRCYKSEFALSITEKVNALAVPCSDVIEITIVVFPPDMLHVDHFLWISGFFFLTEKGWVTKDVSSTGNSLNFNTPRNP